MYRCLYDGYTCFNIGSVQRAFVLEMVDVRSTALDGSTYHYRYLSMSTQSGDLFVKVGAFCRIATVKVCGEFRGQTTVIRVCSADIDECSPYNK